MSGDRVLRGVVFDVDDTLYLERDYVRSGFHDVGEHLERTHGVSGFGEVAWDAFRDGVRGSTFDHTLGTLGVEPTSELIRELVAVYRSHAPRIDPLPDAHSLLVELQRMGIELGVVTDGPAVSQRAKVVALGLEQYTDAIVVTEEHGTGKPDPRVFATAARAMKVASTDLVYIADNPTKDFAGPRSLGWVTVRVRRPHGLHEQLASGDDVDLEATGLVGILEALVDRLGVRLVAP